MYTVRSSCSTTLGKGHSLNVCKKGIPPFSAIAKSAIGLAPQALTNNSEVEQNTGHATYCNLCKHAKSCRTCCLLLLLLPLLPPTATAAAPCSSGKQRVLSIVTEASMSLVAVAATAAATAMVTSLSRLTSGRIQSWLSSSALTKPKGKTAAETRAESASPQIQ